MQAIVTPGSLEEARALDETVKGLVQARRRDVATLAYSLEHMGRAGLHAWLGFPDLPSYALARGAVASKDSARALVQLVERLGPLPLMTAAFVAGEVDHTKLREVSRAAKPSTEAYWLQLAKTRSYRTCRRLAAVARGLEPKEARPFRLSPEQHGWVEEALRVARAEADRPLTDEEALASICKAWLRERGSGGGEAGPTRNGLVEGPDRAGPDLTGAGGRPLAHRGAAGPGASAGDDSSAAASRETEEVAQHPAQARGDPIDSSSPTWPREVERSEGGDEPPVARPFRSSSTLLEALRRLTAG